MPNPNKLATPSTPSSEAPDPFDFSDVSGYRDPYNVNGGNDTGAFDFTPVNPGLASPTEMKQPQQSWESAYPTADTYTYIDPTTMPLDRQDELDRMNDLAPLSPGLAEMRDIHAAGMQALARSELARQAAAERLSPEQESLQAMVEQESRERDRSRYIKIGRAVFGPLMRLMARRREEKDYRSAVKAAPDQVVANRYSTDKFNNPFYVPPQGGANIIEQAATMPLAQRQRFLEENGIIEPSRNR